MLVFPSSTIGKKQAVSATGLLLIVFLIGHLAGNLLILAGPSAYNAYAAKLAGLRPGLYVIEFGLLAVFLIHIITTASLVWDSHKARGRPYKVYANQGNRSLSARWMPVTGTILLVFVILHLLDFTFIDHEGPRSCLADGRSYGLYGVVFNAFSDPLHSTWYLLAMAAVGLHLSHGIESFFQTFGLINPQKNSALKFFSQALGLIVALGFSSIPVYVLIRNLSWP